MLITVQPHLEYGGAERQTVLLSNSLCRRGRTPGVVLHEAKGGLLPELDSGVRVAAAGLENHLLIPVVAQRLKTILERQFIDDSRSLVTFRLWSSLLAGSLIEARSRRHFTFAYYEDSDPASHARYIRLGRAKQRIIARVFRAGGLVVANTHRVSVAMMKIYGLNRQPHVISPAVDLAALDGIAAAGSGADGIARGRPIRIATVGSLIPRKGLDTIYEGLLASGVDCEWHVIGEGPLRRWLEGLPSDRRVLVRPRGGHPRPYELVRGMDLLVHGAHSESFGIVLLEAMAVGTPVLSASAAGPSEMVDVLGDRPDILSLFAVGDSDALAQALRSRVATLSETPNRASMQEYLRPYSVDATTDKWMSLAEDFGCVA